MKDYYQIIGIKRDASQEEIDFLYQKYKKTNQLTSEVYNIFAVLNNTIKRKKYDELIKKIQALSSCNIPFFGYDFDEKYVNTFEQKRYLINNDKYLIYEKECRNGQIIKSYYIEYNGKLELLSENKIKKLKEEYYEQKSHLLKDSPLNKVLPK